MIQFHIKNLTATRQRLAELRQELAPIADSGVIAELLDIASQSTQRALLAYQRRLLISDDVLCLVDLIEQQG